MKIVIDTREQTPFPFDTYECIAVSGTLTTGETTALLG